MIDWAAVAAQLARLAEAAPPARLLSITLPLPSWPAAALPTGGDWCVWQRPDRGLRLLGIGKAFGAMSVGAGRFAALHAAQRGLMEGWRYAHDTLPPLAFTGFAFGSESPCDGGPLPNASLWVPELLLRAQQDAVWITCSCAASRAGDALTRWQEVWRMLTTSRPAVSSAPTLMPPLARKIGSLPPTGASAWGGPVPTCRPNPLADLAFLARGRAALRAIAAGGIDKLVLTRTLRLKADAAIDATPVLATLAAHHPACAIFGVGQAGKAFVGASPEKLLMLHGTQVEVDALAGTAWQDAALSLGADKNRREHDFVARAVAAALAELCADVTVPNDTEVMQLEAPLQLSHLRRRVTARRLANVSAFDLIARLHPTPAVGGTPTSAALDWLDRHGDRRDAWYTGGIGWLDAAGDCDIAVALRCGLLEGNEATIYAGAGFVAGSAPEQELAETEAKFAAMRAALAAACTQAATECDAA